MIAPFMSATKECHFDSKEFLAIGQGRKIVAVVKKQTIYAQGEASCDRPKKASMGGYPFPDFSCAICTRPVDLRTDLSADENGKTVHEGCYVERMTSSLACTANLCPSSDSAFI